MNLLYGVKGSDSMSDLAIVTGIEAVGLAASFISARRASRFAPMSALREEQPCQLEKKGITDDITK